MKNATSSILDYKTALLLLLRNKLHSFFMGLTITSYFSYQVLAAGGFHISAQKIKNTQTGTLSTVKTYTVQLGDDLWGIAEKMYGSGYNSEDIARANKLSEPYTLTENQILIIPSVRSKKPTQGEITDSAAQTERVTEYTVLPGDYLWQIAEKVYGDGNQMSKLIEGNNIPYPYNVETGQTLLVP